MSIALPTRNRILPVIKETFRQYTKQELMDKLEKIGMPFAPIAKPEELFDDPHLKASGGIVAGYGHRW